MISKTLKVSLIISLFVSNFDPYNNKCKNLSLENLFILGSRL